MCVYMCVCVCACMWVSDELLLASYRHTLDLAPTLYHCPFGPLVRPPHLSPLCGAMFEFSLYEILFHFKALLWVSIIFLLPPPTCKAYPIAILLHDHCAIYARPLTPPIFALHHAILVMAISCKGQVRVPSMMFTPESHLPNSAQHGHGLQGHTATGTAVPHHHRYGEHHSRPPPPTVAGVSHDYMLTTRD